MDCNIVLITKRCKLYKHSKLMIENNDDFIKNDLFIQTLKLLTDMTQNVNENIKINKFIDGNNITIITIKQLIKDLCENNIDNLLYFFENS